MIESPRRCPVTDGSRPAATVTTSVAGVAAPGQVYESTQVESVMNGIAILKRLGRPRTRPKKLAADKGHSVPRVRDWLRSRGIKPIIPHKSIERALNDGRGRFDRRAYRQRAVVEQCVGWMKESRRIITRFEKLAVNSHGMLQLAMIRRYLKILFQDRA